MFRNTIIQPEMLNDISPGNLWQPESAARYNAVNELLRNGEAWQETPAAAAVIQPRRLTIPALNVDDTTINRSRGAAVQVYDQVSYDGTKEYVRVKNLPDSAVAGRDSDTLWGVMEDTVGRNESGSLVISGFAMAFVEFDSKHNSEEYRYVQPQGGLLKPTNIPTRAEILWHPKMAGSRHVPILLGGGTSAAARPSGLFQVSYEPYKNVIKINKGYVDYPNNVSGMTEIKEYSMNLPSDYDIRYIFLVCKFDGMRYTGYEYAAVKNFKTDTLYQVRRSLPWPIAAIQKKQNDHMDSVNIDQLWSGGMIPLHSKYYLP